MAEKLRIHVPGYDPEEVWAKVVVLRAVGWRCRRCGFVVWQNERPGSGCVECFRNAESKSGSAVEQQLRFL